MWRNKNTPKENAQVESTRSVIIVDFCINWKAIRIIPKDQCNGVCNVPTFAFSNQEATQ